MKPLHIFGTSGFAREVRDVAIELGYSVTFVSRAVLPREEWPDGSEVITETTFATLKSPSAAIGIGDNGIRAAVFERYRGTVDFPTLIHSTASFGHGQRAAVTASRATIVCAGVRFTNGITVGDACIFNLNCTIGHDVIVGEGCNIAPGANISGYVELEPRVWVGTNAAINQGDAGKRLVVGRDTTIGSGSVVVRDCEPQAIYVGIPAKRR